MVWSVKWRQKFTSDEFTSCVITFIIYWQRCYRAPPVLLEFVLMFHLPILFDLLQLCMYGNSKPSEFMQSCIYGFASKRWTPVHPSSRCSQIYLFIDIRKFALLTLWFLIFKNGPTTNSIHHTTSTKLVSKSTKAATVWNEITRTWISPCMLPIDLESIMWKQYKLQRLATCLPCALVQMCTHIICQIQRSHSRPRQANHKKS